MPSLVGSEMCIRDRYHISGNALLRQPSRWPAFLLRVRSPPKCKPPPKPPDEFIRANVAELLRTPTLIDCGAEGHIVKSLGLLDPHTTTPTSMVTEAFSGAKAPITHIGDHISGLFPRCHVVPQSTFNLLAVGPYMDNNPNHAIVLTATSAIQLHNLNFDNISTTCLLYTSPSPRD